MRPRGDPPASISKNTVSVTSASTLPPPPWGFPIRSSKNPCEKRIPWCSSMYRHSLLKLHPADYHLQRLESTRSGHCLRPNDGAATRNECTGRSCKGNDESNEPGHVFRDEGNSKDKKIFFFLKDIFDTGGQPALQWRALPRSWP